MKTNWAKGIFNFLRKREERICARKGCDIVFKIIPSSPKIYCSSSCAAKVNNIKSGPLSEKTKSKISRALKGRRNPYKGVIKVPRIKTKCANPRCGKIFLRERWRERKFCSNKCSMIIIGGRPTSPKAARGKAGIRKDINKTIYFYSRWEANMARLFNLLSIKWIHQPKTFDLSSQNYTPDFYLSDYDVYIEVKNFLGEYSRIRDQKFRKLFPNVKLILLLKKDYLELQKKYSRFIKNWEYKNSPFQNDT
jgi:hypothetical protein